MLILCGVTIRQYCGKVELMQLTDRGSGSVSAGVGCVPAANHTGNVRQA